MKTMKNTKEGTGLRSMFTKGMMMLMIFVGLLGTDCLAQQKKSTSKSKTANSKTTETPAPTAFAPGKESGMRKLWNDHIVWTRQYMISEMSGAADKDAIFNRLRQNAQDMAKAMKETHPSIDDKVLGGILDSTVLMMTKLIFETNLGSDRTGAFETKEALMKHLDRTAQYLNTANPGWSLAELKLMLQGYLNETHNEILARKNQIWDADIAAYDRLNNHVMKLADAFATGTIQLENPQQQPVVQDGKTPTGKNSTGATGK